MAPTTRIGPPKKLTAGNTMRWKVAAHSDYPQADSWILKYVLAGPEREEFNATWQASGDDANNWLVDESPAETADYTPGTYTLFGYFDDDSEQYEVFRDVFIVLPDPRAAETGALQSHEERMIPLLEANIEGHLRDDELVSSYGALGRSVTALTLPERERMLSAYRSKVYRRQNPGQVGVSTGVRFTRAR